MTPLAQLVRPLVKARGLTLVAFAKRVDLTDNNLSKVLNGSARLTVPVALRIAAELELDVRQVLAAQPAKRLYGGSPR